MTDYSQVPDYEINARVGESLGMTAHFIEHDGRVKFRDEKGRIQGTKDYCNNPADAWPIIVESLIEVSPDYDFTDESERELCATGFWTANHVESDGTSYYQSHQNPLRAAMIVFLMKKDAEKC
jgi:hypothetical protein